MSSADTSSAPRGASGSRGGDRGGRGNRRGRGGGERGGGGYRGRGGRGGARGGTNNATSSEPRKEGTAEEDTPAVVPATQSAAAAALKGPETAGSGDDDGDGEVCFICANTIVHHSVAPCNHRTCHICGLRMRALYKTKDCAHCRTAADFVIFTDDPEKPYESYTDANISSTDTNIGIRYANEDMVGDTVLLLRYNCPEPTCDFAGLGWPNLHKHVRTTHHKKMCDLCTRNKKVFTHEHDLFTDKELEKHMRRGDDKPGAVDQTGFKGHPLCSFCGERFYDDDKLFLHCREKHERCFLCDRRDSRHPHYYRDYESLEKHFGEDHFPCLDRECQEKKFIVFDSELDLKAHQLSEHGNSLSKDVRRDTRVVDMSNFNYRPSYQEQTRRGGRDRDNRPRGADGRSRDESGDPLPATSANMRREDVMFQRQQAIQSAQSVTSRTFGSQLSSSTPPPQAEPQQTPASAPSQRAAALDPEAPTVNLASLSPEARARALRHIAVTERASSLVGNDAAKLATFRTLISKFKSSAINASTLLDSFFTLFSDASPNATSTLIREVADLFEDAAKADALRKALSDWRAINEDYPSLPGLGGMQGSTTATSGWASAAAASPSQGAIGPEARHSTRVLKLKSTTKVSSTARSMAGTFRSGSDFPALPSASTPVPSQKISTWASTTTPVPTPGGSSSSLSVGASSSRGRPAVNSKVDFPALPDAPKPQLTIWGPGGGGRGVRREQAAATGFSWGDKKEDGDGDDDEDNEGEDGKSKGKGKKGRKKVYLALR